MSEFDDAMAAADLDLFDAFGQDATVQRGAAAAVDVRVVLEDGVQVLGDYGQVVGTVTQASFINDQWEPQQGDVLALASGTRKVDKIVENDGLVTTVVLHG